MNPGNGIETITHQSRNLLNESFKFMNPGNGIETKKFSFLFRRKSSLSNLWIPATGLKLLLILSAVDKFQFFQIYESRQRDWNNFSEFEFLQDLILSNLWIPATGLKLLSNPSARLSRTSFKFMNPGNGIETFPKSLDFAVLIAFKFMNPGNGIETC